MSLHGYFYDEEKKYFGTIIFNYDKILRVHEYIKGGEDERNSG